MNCRQQLPHQSTTVEEPALIRSKRSHRMIFSAMDVQLALWFALLLYCLGTALSEDIELDTTLECHVRQYTYHIDKSMIDTNGELLECWDDVTVNSCWGRCDSSEMPDYRWDKISNHKVCTYERRHDRKVKLRNCDPRHPEPEADVFDAVACDCLPCSPDDTSCQHLNG